MSGFRERAGARPEAGQYWRDRRRERVVKVVDVDSAGVDYQHVYDDGQLGALSSFRTDRFLKAFEIVEGKHADV